MVEELEGEGGCNGGGKRMGELNEIYIKQNTMNVIKCVHEMN